MSTATESKTTELRRLLADLYDAFAVGDASAWANRLTEAHSPFAFGTDPQEACSGAEQLRTVFDAQVKEMNANGITFQGGDAKIDIQSDVAWVADQPTLRMGDAVAVPMRLSLVLVNEGGQWNMAHFHLSVGVPNEQLLNVTLTV